MLAEPGAEAAAAVAAGPEGGIRIVEYTDPYSVWCWGCEPAVRRLEALFPDAVRVDVVMGGLFEDFGPVREYWARTSGGRWKDSVLTFMRAVADQHRMPMDPERMLAAVDDFESTWPACIAVKAAELQGPAGGRRYLRRLREAVLIEGRPIHRRDVQAELAEDVGLDAARFVRALADGSADRSFHADLETCQARGVTGFPTFELTRGLVSLRIEGWQPWEVVDKAVRNLDPDLQPRFLEPTAPAVARVLRRFGRSATREIAAVFSLTDDDAEILMENLEAEGVVHRREAGSGDLWEPAPRPI